MHAPAFDAALGLVEENGHLVFRLLRLGAVDVKLADRLEIHLGPDEHEAAADAGGADAPREGPDLLRSAGAAAEERTHSGVGLGEVLQVAGLYGQWAAAQGRTIWVIWRY